MSAYVAGNDQELYREGLNMFFNEQAFREGALKGVEGIVSNENATALMMSFNGLGVVWSSSQHRADHSGDPQRMGL
ncbi:MAG: hypothetical protein ACLUAM_08685 [Bifidobacterium adolescentis]